MYHVFCCNLSNKLVFVMIDPSVTSWAKKGVRQLNSTHILLIINHIPYTCKRSCHNSSSGLFAKKKKEHQRANKSGKKNYGKTQMGVIGSSLVIILEVPRGQ